MILRMRCITSGCVHEGEEADVEITEKRVGPFRVQQQAGVLCACGSEPWIVAVDGKASTNTVRPA
jgi:hypothetical protein